MNNPLGPTGGASKPVGAVSPSARADSLPGEAGRGLPVAGTSVARPAPGPGSATVKLSEAAAYITELLRLLPAIGSEPASQSPIATAASAWLRDPLASASERATSLADVVRHSGLFYESHLRAWAEGRLLLDRLAHEPQARAAEMLKDASPAEREAANTELARVLQQQLDVLDGKPLRFDGHAWPGQPVQWRVQRDAEEGEQHPAREHGTDDVEGATGWTTHLQLSLPRLGDFGARLRVVGSQVTLAVRLDNDAGAALLDTHRDRLATALQAVGLTLADLKHEPKPVPHEPAGPPQRRIP
jgi:hypothetical protein